MAAPTASTTKAALRCRCLGVEVKWRVSDGTTVKEGDVVLDLVALDKTTSTAVWSPAYGVVRHHPEPTNASTDGLEADIGWIDICQHDVLTSNRLMCQICLKRFEDGGANHTVKVIMNDGKAMQVSHTQAKKLDNDNIARMFKTEKLTLVLDLDHTLLHAVRLEDVVDPIESYVDILHFEIPGIPTPHVLKLRPGLATFLSDLAAMYELCIYTHGTRKYAEKIADIIDPGRKLFGGRIISRSDTPDIGHKDLKFLFPSCDDSMIIILDDRIDVWRKNYENVFIIEAYHYFNTRAEINNASGGGGGKGNLASVPKEDTHLQKTYRVLQAAHSRFYQPGADEEAQIRGQGRSVKRILYDLRHQVLADVHIVFSGVIRLDRPPQVDYLWKLALSFGAKPSMTMDDVPITHLIIDPRRLGSKKFMDAIAMKHVLVVNPQWLVDSASEWQRQDEAKYAVSSSSQRPPSFAADTDVKLEQSATVKFEGETATRTDVPVRPTLLASTPENATESEEGRGGDGREEYPPATLYDEIDASIDAESRLQETTTAVPNATETPAAVATSSRDGAAGTTGKPLVKGILSSPASIGVHKAKKSVRFAADVKEPSVQFSNLPKRSRGVQRKGGPLPARVTPKGVVESGGSLEFVTNLVSRKPRAASNVAPPMFNRVVVAPALASKRVETNDDDIFSRLAHLEEEEEEEDKPVKRKQSALFQDLEAAKKAKTLALQQATDDADDDLDDLDDELFS
ncbi:hypothetical protein H257_10020 [Aphanomyces astaci]|uniref:RNA polymerase II subunit A C-terminal domain phosphatase n=1 Tax=Aphanomyces astaci TaxID=112090 RepID=W4G7E0_APHAT|nr:hypothetical protein H257_10020 [Aphanomyces astaci]ETV75612.1 hypothetical protein H257_10020 [Aphanomyces astaci]|eukprot:XP_009834743.1 hypothetical protein H257_10020 [Aphanomyces astaci]